MEKIRKKCSVCGGELVKMPNISSLVEPSREIKSIFGDISIVEIELSLCYCRKCKAVFYCPNKQKADQEEKEKISKKEKDLLAQAFC